MSKLKRGVLSISLTVVAVIVIFMATIGLMLYKAIQPETIDLVLDTVKNESYAQFGVNGQLVADTLRYYLCPDDEQIDLAEPVKQFVDANRESIEAYISSEDSNCVVGLFRMEPYVYALLLAVGAAALTGAVWTGKDRLQIAFMHPAVTCNICALLLGVCIKSVFTPVLEGIIMMQIIYPINEGVCEWLRILCDMMKNTAYWALGISLLPLAGAVIAEMDKIQIKKASRSNLQHTDKKVEKPTPFLPLLGLTLFLLLCALLTLTSVSRV